jgi:pyridoxal biosynthesis lyase PdxS
MAAGNGMNGATIGTTKVKQGLAQMLKGGVIVSDLSA